MSDEYIYLMSIDMKHLLYSLLEYAFMSDEYIYLLTINVKHLLE